MPDSPDGFRCALPDPTPGLNRKALAPRSTRQRHQSASNQPELILKLPSAVPDLGDTADFLFDWPRGSGNEANRHVAGIGVVVCDRRDPLGHRRLILASGHGRDDRRRQPWWRRHNPSSRRARNRPSRRFPLRCSMTCRRRPAVGSEALARWFVAPGTPPATRAAEALLAPLPLAPATTIAGQPGQDSKAGIKPLEGDARPTRKPRDSNAQMPAKRRTANARACGSPSRFSDLLRRLNLASRCPTRRSAA